MIIFEITWIHPTDKNVTGPTGSLEYILKLEMFDAQTVEDMRRIPATVAKHNNRVMVSMTSVITAAGKTNQVRHYTLKKMVVLIICLSTRDAPTLKSMVGTKYHARTVV